MQKGRRILQEENRQMGSAEKSQEKKLPILAVIQKLPNFAVDFLQTKN
jgi:hypothetical protein